MMGTSEPIQPLEYAPSDANNSWRGVSIILCALVGGISANVLVHDYQKWQVERNRVQVLSNLQQIGRALQQYSGSAAGFPKVHTD
jgi:hypothetical protein